MAAAFDRAGFDAVDVHMSDIIAGRVSLRELSRLRRLRRFLLWRRAGRGGGLGQVDSVQSARARRVRGASSGAATSFALGVCNGCQMMSNLRELIPGAEHWPHFVRNRSEQFEARFAMVEVTQSPSLFFAGMEGSRMPIAVAHGEGYAEFSSARQLAAARKLVALRLRRQPRQTHGALPVQSERITRGHHRADHARRPLHHPHAASGARVPHACRTHGIRAEWGEDAPWMRMFRNARRWVG